VPVGAWGRFHHLLMVASLRERCKLFLDESATGFHHLLMVASLRELGVEQLVLRRPSFHHLLMVASLRACDAAGHPWHQGPVSTIF